MRRRVGESVAAGYRCFSPPVDDLSAYVELGTVEPGVPVRIFRPVAEADLRILIGSVLPHLQAGFGGGYKLILPGTSHRTTLGALHRQGLVGRGGSDASGLLGGDAADNPMRRTIHAAAELLGPCWSISHLIGGPGQIFRVVAGRPESVQELLASEARRRFRAPEGEPADVVVAGNHPWPGDPMQSFKVLLHHRAACRPGGALVGPVLDRPGGDRPLVPGRRPARDRRHRSPRRLGHPPPDPGRPARRRPDRLPGGLHDPMGPRAGRRPHRPRLCPTPARPVGPRWDPSGCLAISMSSGRSWPGPVIGQRTAGTGKHRFRTRFASTSSRRADSLMYPGRTAIRPLFAVRSRASSWDGPRSWIA